MILKRLPLFIAGLIYGIVLNCTVLGLAYGIVGIGYGIYGLCRLFGEVGDPACCVAEDGIIAVGIIIGAILAVAGAVGLVVGVGYGLTFGTWHCAMDFYNNGLKQGLTSPFRFLSAHWEKNWKNNPAPLNTYYESTDISFLERKAVAEKAIQNQSRDLHIILSSGKTSFQRKDKKDTLTSIPTFPKRLSQHIAMFSTEPDRCMLGSSRLRQVARTIENVSVGEVKVAPPQTAAVYFTPQEAADIIKKDGFFSESTHRQPKQASIPPKNVVKHVERPLRSLRPFPC